MKKGVIAAVAAIALVGVAVAAIPLVESYAASRIKAEIERDGTTTVDGVEVGLFGRRVTLTSLKSDRAAGLSIGRWEASGLGWPLAELMQGHTPLAGFRWGEPLQADRVEMHDMRIGTRGVRGEWTVDSLVVDAFDLARFDVGDVGHDDPLALVARAMRALSVRRLEQRGTVYAMPASGDTLGVAAVVVEGYGGGRLATATVNGIEATRREGRAPLIRVADIDIRGLDFRRILTVLSEGGWHPGAPLGQVKVDRASASGFSGETMTQYGISLGSMTVETTHESDKVSRSRARIEGFELAPPLRSMDGLRLRMALQAMGLRELKLGFDCAGVEDRERAEVTVDRCALSGAGLGEIGFTSRIVGADDAFWRAVDDGDAAAFYDSKAALASARLVLADKSLLERGLKALAATTGQTVAAVRANLARDIRRFQPAGVLITQRLTQLLDVGARFVEEGGTLTVEAHPEPPLTLERFEHLASPGADLVNDLGLTATLSR